MRPTTANTNVFHFNALLHPDTVFDHPGLDLGTITARFHTISHRLITLQIQAFLR